MSGWSADVGAVALPYSKHYKAVVVAAGSGAAAVVVVGGEAVPHIGFKPCGWAIIRRSTEFFCVHNDNDVAVRT